MSIIAESSTVSYGVCVLALPGVISLNAMVPGKRATTASHVGPGTAPGKPSSPRYKCKQMNVAKLTGMEQHWIAPTSKPTAARWVPVSNLLSGKKGHSTCEWLGYSRGGRTTKLHLLTDGHRRPLSVLLSAGQAFDGNFLTPLLDAVRVPRRGRGRPRKRPTTLRMDRAYGAGKYRSLLRQRGIRCVCPFRADARRTRLHKGREGGRPPNFDSEAYKGRHVVECAINRLKDFRAIGVDSVSSR